MTSPRASLLLCAMGSALGAGCVVRLPPAAYYVAEAASRPRPETTTATRPQPPPPPAPAPAARPAAPPTPTPPAPSPYLPDEALADAMSGPLELVGVGGWPGVFRRLSCVYRNGRVFVVDERCSDPREPTGLVVHVLSPTRGRATLFVDAGNPIGAARRPDYKSIGAATTAPRKPPATLDTSMTYEEVVAYEDVPPRETRGICSAGTQAPRGSCSKGASATPEAFAAAASPFLSEPPPAWYDLVRSLVGLRLRAHAAIRPASLPLPRLSAWGASWARDLDVTVDEGNMKRVGNPQGRTASIAVTADGGALIAGTTSRAGVTVPAVVRADEQGRRRWVKALPERGMVTHEIASVAAVPDGAIVLSPGYPDPGWKPTSRVLRLDDKGNVRWQWLGRGKDRHKIPQIVTAELTPQGTVLLRGYVQLVADGDVHLWTAELDFATGKARREEVGPVLPDHGASFE